ncbi:MAG: penicillin-insensitive murein endopeptidase [Polyangiaceae bacterium]|nr:penicillin-insensitive murein endopeptidase [Polyangiaceae bacterium]
MARRRPELDQVRVVSRVVGAVALLGLAACAPARSTGAQPPGLGPPGVYGGYPARSALGPPMPAATAPSQPRETSAAPAAGPSSAAPSPLAPAALEAPVAAGNAEDASAAEELATVGDDVEDGPGDAVAGPPAAPTARPFAELGNGEIERRVASDLASLGPISVGWANQGGLVNAVQMPRAEGWNVLDPADTWGTQETVDALIRCIGIVRARHPGSPRLSIGQMSAPQGGRLASHKSHQSGRDVDVGYYFTGGEQRGFVRATAGNLDRARTWTFVRALFTDAHPEFVFIDTSVQKVLKEYALSIGEDPAWLDRIFQYQSHEPWPIIRYAPGHADHIHVRFYNPRAQEMGVRAYDALVKHGKYRLPTVKQTKSSTETEYVVHVAHSGDTLDLLARRYATTVQAIREANGLKSAHIKAKQQLKIPTKKTKVVTTVVTDKAKPPPRAVQIPPRRLPPRDPPALAAQGGGAVGTASAPR